MYSIVAKQIPRVNNKLLQIIFMCRPVAIITNNMHSGRKIHGSDFIASFSSSGLWPSKIGTRIVQGTRKVRGCKHQELTCILDL